MVEATRNRPKMEASTQKPALALLADGEAPTNTESPKRHSLADPQGCGGSQSDGGFAQQVSDRQVVVWPASVPAVAGDDASGDATTG